MNDTPPTGQPAPTRLGYTALARAVTGSGALYAANLVLAFVISVLLARLLGPEALGVYSLPLAIVTVVGLPIHVGLSTLLVRETARGLLRGRLSKIHDLWRWADRAIVKFSLAAGAILLAASFIPWGTSSNTLVLAICLLLIPIVAVSQARSASLRGLDYAVLGTVSENLVRPLLFALALGGALFLIPRLATPANAMLAHVVAAGGAALFSMLALARVHPRTQQGEPATDVDFARWRKAFWPLAIIAGAQVGLQNLNVTLLGLARPAYDVGIFKVALSLSNLGLIGSTIATVVFAQKIARYHEAGDHAHLQSSAGLAALIALVGALPPLLVLAFFGEAVLDLLYGSEFTAGYRQLLALVIGQGLAAACGLCVTLLNMAGHERETLKGLGVAVAANFALAAALLPSLGALGIAVATAATQLIWSVMLMWSVRSKLGIDSTVLGLFR